MQDLVERAKHGDLEAFGLLVQQFQDAVYGTACAILGSFHDAQDVAQDVFIQAWSALGSLERAESFPGWLYRMTRNRCLDVLKQQRRRTERVQRAARPVAFTDDPAQSVARAEIRDAVLAAIGSLSEPKRLATTLFYIDGYSVNEVAEFLDVPSGTVKRRLHDAREQLKERMMAMVEDTLKSHGLPDGFTQETLDKALAQARELNEQRKSTDAEQLLRGVLDKVPDHPEVLKELNRALLRGRIWRQQKYELLPELTTHGRAILEAGQDEATVYVNICDTLLYIPDMPKAIEFMEAWIERKGASLPSLGRLAYAKACLGHYGLAESTWGQFHALAEQGTHEDALKRVWRTCDALVDCFSVAGHLERAVRVLRAGWDFVRVRDVIRASTKSLPWIHTFAQAGLREEGLRVAREWHAALGAAAGRDAQIKGTALIARAWFDDTEAVTADWLAWVEKCLATEAWDRRAWQSVSSRMLFTLARAGELDERRELGGATAKLLRDAANKEANAISDWVRVTALAPEVYLDAGDLETAERLARQVEEPHWLHDIAVLRGVPSPPELMQEIAEKGADEATHGAWYHVAREAAAAGDMATALNALRRACTDCWWLEPAARLEMWENDTRWGALRDHPEFKATIAAKRERVGVAYGQLKYSPGW